MMSLPSLSERATARPGSRPPARTRSHATRSDDSLKQRSPLPKLDLVLTQVEVSKKHEPTELEASCRILGADNWSKSPRIGSASPSADFLVYPLRKPPQVVETALVEGSPLPSIPLPFSIEWF